MTLYMFMNTLFMRVLLKNIIPDLIKDHVLVFQRSKAYGKYLSHVTVICSEHVNYQVFL